MVVFSKLVPAFSSLAGKQTAKAFQSFPQHLVKINTNTQYGVATCNRIPGATKVIIGQQQQQRTFSSTLFNTTNNNNTSPSPSEPLDELKQPVLPDDGVNESKVITLSVVEFKKWSKEQTTSVLCAPEEQGGAGLTTDDVKPLYGAGFKGNVLGNIVVNIDKYDEEKALSQLKTTLKDGGIAITPELANTLESVVNWVNNQLMPKLYHLWSVGQIKEQLGKPIDEGGAGLSVDDVKPLFDAGFKGNVLPSIVVNINELGKREALSQLVGNKDFQHVAKSTLKSVVNWVNNQLKGQSMQLSLPLIESYVFLKGSLNSINALSLVDLTNRYQVDQNDTLIYSHPQLKETVAIFNNLIEFKTIQDRFKDVYAKRSPLRGRPSFEIHGQVRTGKTHCSRFIVPYYITQTMNKLRMEEGKPILKLCPVVYVRFTATGNHLKEIYNALEPIREALNIKETETPNPDYKQLIVRNITKFGAYSPNCHLFIVLDEVQLIDSTILDTMREIAKSKDLNYHNSTFILTGSTQSRFVRVLASTVKNGLSYTEAAITHTIPFDLQNPKQLEELCIFSNISKPSKEDLIFLEDTFGGLNIAYFNQIFAIVPKETINKAVDIFLNEIFSIYDRDIFTPLANKPIDADLEKIRNQLLPLKDISPHKHEIMSPFASKYLTIETKTVGGISTSFYKFRDVLLEYYLTRRLYKDEQSGTYYISNTEFTAAYISVDTIALFGEKIARWKSYIRNKEYTTLKKYAKSIQTIEDFLQYDPFLANLQDRNIDNLYQELDNISNKYPSSSKKSLPPLRSTVKKEKLEQLFIQTRNLIRHEHYDSNPREIETDEAYLIHFFNGDRYGFRKFSIRIRSLGYLPI